MNRSPRDLPIDNPGVKEIRSFVARFLPRASLRWQAAGHGCKRRAANKHSGLLTVSGCGGRRSGWRLGTFLDLILLDIDLRHPDKLVAFVELDQSDTRSVPTRLTDLGNARADEDALLRDHHDLGGIFHEGHADDFAVALV